MAPKDPENEDSLGFAVHLTARTFAAAATIALSTAVLIVGMLLALLTGWIWPSLPGAVGLAVGLFAAAATQRKGSRWAAAHAASRDRPRRRDQVFVSYRTAEHSREAERIAELIREAGVTAICKKTGQAMVPAGTETPGARAGAAAEALATLAFLSAPRSERHTPPGRAPASPAVPFDFAAISRLFEAIGFYQCAGLDALLHREIAASDAVVFLVPTSGSPRTPRRQLRDLADCLLALVLYRCGASPMFWRSVGYAIAYGRPLAVHIPLVSVKTWQDWEVEIARALKVPVIEVHVHDGDDTRASPKQHVCRRGDLEADFRKAALPEVLGAARSDLAVASGHVPEAALALFLWAYRLALGLGVIVGGLIAGIVLGVRALL